jgi:hypothetical protein
MVYAEKKSDSLGNTWSQNVIANREEIQQPTVSATFFTVPQGRNFHTGFAALPRVEHATGNPC